MGFEGKPNGKPKAFGGPPPTRTRQTPFRSCAHRPLARLAAASLWPQNRCIPIETKQPGPDACSFSLVVFPKAHRCFFLQSPNQKEKPTALTHIRSPEVNWFISTPKHNSICTLFRSPGINGHQVRALVRSSLFPLKKLAKEVLERTPATVAHQIVKKKSLICVCVCVCYAN